jgi:hypothetical protein
MGEMNLQGPKCPKEYTFMGLNTHGTYYCHMISLEETDGGQTFK